MARLKQHHLRRSPPDEISDEDYAMDGGAEPHSPARSLSDSDIVGTPPSPSVSGFIIEPIRPVTAGEDSVVTPKRSSARSGSKRLSEQEDGEVKTKTKKKKSSSSAATVTPTPVADGRDEEVKKSSGAIQRIWSEEDAIAILKGVIEFRAKTGSDPRTDAVAFLEFIRDSIHVDASKSQLMSKVRKLKRKFLVNWKKCEKGEDPVFTKSHDSTAFELSKKIWGKAESDDETMIHNKGRMRGKQEMRDKKTPDSVVPETNSEEPSTPSSPKQVTNAKKIQKVSNSESEKGDKPKKPRGDFEALANAAVAAAAAEFYSNPEVVDDGIDMVVEEECNGKENGEAACDETEMVVEKDCNGEENGDPVDDEIEMDVEKGCDEKENGCSGEAKSNPEVVDGGIEMVVGRLCNGGSGEAKSHPEVVDGRIEMVADMVSHGKEKGGSSDADALWARYPYLQDALETIVSGEIMGDIQKRLFLKKVGVSGDGKWREWDDRWEAFRREETLLQIRKHKLMAEFAAAALDELKKQI